MATHTDEKLELLKRVPLLSGLGKRDIVEVGRLAEEIDLGADHVLMREGGSGSEFFVIIDGTVRIERGGVKIRSLGPGDFLGEIALVDDGPRTATATTESPAKLLVVGHRTGFLALTWDRRKCRRLAVTYAARRARVMLRGPVSPGPMDDRRG